MDSKITYAHLDSVLLHLGFEKKEFENSHTLYVRKPEQALIVLPLAAANDRVPLPELVTAKKTVVEKGVATEETWEALLDEEKRKSDLEPLRALHAQIVELEAEAREWQRHGEKLNARITELENQLHEKTRQLTAIGN